MTASGRRWIYEDLLEWPPRWVAYCEAKRKRLRPEDRHRMDELLEELADLMR